MSSKAYSEAQGFLHQIDPTGQSLYEHITGLVQKFLDERPEDAFRNFEFYSSEVKQCQLPVDDAVDGATKVVEENQPQIHALAQKLSLYEAPKKTKKTKAPAATVAQIPNLFEEADYFSYFGVGLTEDEIFHLHLGIQRLIDEYAPAAVRFFGRINAIHNYYYIIEAEFKREPVAAPPAAEEDADAEKAANDEAEDGDDENKPKAPVEVKRPEIRKPHEVPTESQTGPNQYTYYVTTKVGESWIQLPDVTPAQISVARQIRKMLTGNLNAEIHSYPPFPGTEVNYLRAQIARISSATYISPKGFYVAPEESDESAPASDLEANPEFEEIEVNEMTNLENWVHHRRFILPQGRTEYWKPPKEPKPDKEDDAEEEEEEEEETKESGPAPLAPLNEDTQIDGKVPAWLLRRPGTGFIPSKFIPVILSSSYWPGSFTYGLGKKFATYYFGNGLKYIHGAYTPPPPPIVLGESETPTETIDPTVEQEREFEEANKPPPADHESVEPEEDEEGDGEDE